MIGPVFVDTNVLVYAKNPREPIKHAQAAGWLRALWQTGAGRISFQVLNEFYFNLARGRAGSCAPAEQRSLVQDLLVWKPVTQDESLTKLSWLIQDRHGFAWWDCLIIAAAELSGSRYLLTEDLQHGQRLLDGLTVLSPFIARPSDLVSDSD